MTLSRSFNTHTVVSHIVRFIFISIVILALGYFFMQIFRGEQDISHQKNQGVYLPLLIEGGISTLKMLVIVALSATIIGTLFAWILSNYSFPFKAFFQKFLLFPLVLPPLLTGIAFVGFFEIGGIIYNVSGKYIDVMRSYWLYIILTLHTFPYAYNIAQGFYSGEYQDLKKTYLSLGIPRIRRLKAYFRSYLPYSLRGLSLISMELLGEFALCSYFGYITLNTLLYSEWRGKGNLHTAVSIGMISFVIAISLVRLATFFHASLNHEKHKRILLLRTPSKFVQAILSTSFLLPFVLITCVPLLVFIRWSILLKAPFGIVVSDFLQSFSLSFFASLLIITLAFLCTYVLSFSSKNKLDWIFSLGYALPSSLIGVSFILLFGILGSTLGINLLGASIPLIVAYVIRYMNFAYSSLSMYFYTLGKNIKNTYLSLGLRPIKLFILQLSVLKKRLIILFLLIFIEISKDIGITIVLRPINFDNLATRIYELINDERSVDTAPYALALIALNLLVFLWYSPYKKKEEYDVT